MTRPPAAHPPDAPHAPAEPVPARPVAAPSPELAAWLAAAVAGDRPAFAALVRHFQRPLFAFLGRMGLGQATAEDLAQETFVRAWQHLAQYRADQGAFSTWLYTIARRLALNELDRAEHRHRDPRPSHTLGTAPGDAPALPEPACPQPGPAQTLAQRQQAQALQAALRQLPSADRSVLALAYVHDLSLADVARIEACSEAAVKARLHRARQHLRQRLDAATAPDPTLPRSPTP